MFPPAEASEGYANFVTSYKLAEKLTDRLDEMGKDLTTMIDEINASSSTLSTNSKADDPVSSSIFSAIQANTSTL